jgi:integrin beta 8
MLNAFDTARLNGFAGSKEEWLAGPKKAAPEYLKGRDGLSAYEVALSQGFDGSESEWLASLRGADGLSAYEIALADGFSGSIDEWLSSLRGADGRSAYQIWRDRNEGSVADFLASLVGPRGLPGGRGLPGEPGDKGIDGLDGATPEHRWIGTSLQFKEPGGDWGQLVNLQGPAGAGMGGVMAWSKVEW